MTDTHEQRSRSADRSEHRARPMSRNLRIVVEHLRGMGFDISDSVVCARTHAGRHQRDAGAWSWALQDRELHCDIGSQDTLEMVARAVRENRLVVSYCRQLGQWELDAEDDVVVADRQPAPTPAIPPRSGPGRCGIHRTGDRR